MNLSSRSNVYKETKLNNHNHIHSHDNFFLVFVDTILKNVAGFVAEWIDVYKNNLL